MSKKRDIRRLAMQVLYQMDLTGTTDAHQIGQTLDEEYDSAEVCAEAVALAASAWCDHDRADTEASELAPKWPTYRRPPVDRAILRLAYHEMVTGRTPVKVAINEAIELAKVYCARESAAFLNGVLDKMARRMRGKAENGEGQAAQGSDDGAESK